jgi:hypothetical protein
LENRGWPLKKWQRILRTNDGMAPTRRAVIKLQVSNHSYPPGEVGFSQRHPFNRASAESTREVLRKFLEEDPHGVLEDGNIFGTGGQLQRAKVMRTTFEVFENFLLDFYESLQGVDSFQLNSLLEHLAQISTLNSERPGACFVFHEWGTTIRGELDKRGPRHGAEGFKDEETEISGFSRSNARDQIPVFYHDLPVREFIVHVYQFDLYRVSAETTPSPTQIFAENVPVLQIRVPHLDLQKMNRQL